MDHYCPTMDHNTLIILLSDMGTPGWLLKLVVAFLEDRKIILNHNGCTTNEESLPGGGPQGTKLGLFLFLILINNAGFKPEQMCSNIGEEMTKPRRESVPRTQQKYIDDMTQCVAINLKKATVPNQTSPQPWQYHERTGHVLRPEENPIQTEVIALAKYAEDHKMKINKNKTKVMVFNQAKPVDILPEVKLDENELEVVEEEKITRNNSEKRPKMAK